MTTRPDYRTYEAEDFLADSWFLAWVKHDRPNAREWWRDWMEKHPARRDTLLLAKDMAEALRNRPVPLSAEQEKQEVQRIVALTRHLPEEKRRRLWWPWAAVAGVALAIGVYLFRPAPVPQEYAGTVLKEVPAGWLTRANGTDKPLKMSLPDGSQVTLYPKSTVAYPPGFAPEEREIELDGEAVFSVVHEGKRPFTVHTRSLKTRVLGTQFRVVSRAADAKQVVSVISGKVSVTKAGDARERGGVRSAGSGLGVVLTANQQVTYDMARTTFVKELVRNPLPVRTASAAAKETFRFDETPAAEVFERLKKAYGVEIIYDAATLRHCTLTASLEGVPLYDQLSLLCASIGATYEVIDARIVVTGRDCS